MTNNETVTAIIAILYCCGLSFKLGYEYCEKKLRKELDGSTKKGKENR